MKNQEKYKSCHSIEGELFFNHLNKVGYCCMLTPNGGQPVLYNDYCGENIDWDLFFENREKHIQLMKNGDALPECKDCLWIKENNWDERKRNFKYILLNNWVKCNLYCIYCSNHEDKNVLENTKEYNLVPVLSDMIKKKLITPDTKIDIAGGEATLDKNFENLINLLVSSGVKNININTNATIFSNSILIGIEKGYISIITSIDAGNKKSFEYIKKKNLWEEVWNNISRYSAKISCNNSNTVSTKFIILPNVNDSISEIRTFILKSKKMNVSKVILNIDLHWLRKNAEDAKTMKKIINLTRFFIYFSKKKKIEWQVWAHIEDLIKRYNVLCPAESLDISMIFDTNNKSIKRFELFKILVEYFMLKLM